VAPKTSKGPPMWGQSVAFGSRRGDSPISPTHATRRNSTGYLSATCPEANSASDGSSRRVSANRLATFMSDDLRDRITSTRNTKRLAALCATGLSAVALPTAATPPNLPAVMPGMPSTPAQGACPGLFHQKQPLRPLRGYSIKCPPARNHRPRTCGARPLRCLKETDSGHQFQYPEFHRGARAKRGFPSTLGSGGLIHLEYRLEASGSCCRALAVPPTHTS
jgi:hypothetical protein